MVDVTEQKLDLSIENLEKALEFDINSLYENKKDLDTIILFANKIVRVADTLGLLYEFKEIPLADINDWQNVE
mgnify:CR=1 FL=1|jgi:hypothetical protein